MTSSTASRVPVVMPSEGDESDDDQSSNSFATSPVVTVFVGPKRKAYSFHKDVLVEKCPFFEKCLKNSYKEGQEYQVYLADESPAIFDRFVTFVYYNRVDKKMTAPDNSLLIRTFALADKFCMPTFQNALIDAIACFHKTRPVSSADLAFINGHVPSNSKIRTFLLDQMAYDIVDGEVNNQTDPLAKDANEILGGGGDLAIELFWNIHNADSKEKYWPSSWSNRCDYHNHQMDDKRQCYQAREEEEKDLEKSDEE